MSIYSDIIKARDLLTTETWHKGSYFSERNGKVCMCAHGAQQAVSNPRVSKALETEGLTTAEAAAAEADAAAAAAAEAAAEAEARAEVAAEAAAEAGAIPYLESARHLFAGRPAWVRGVLDVHYVLGMAGLTVGFNDAPETTLDMVQAKFTEAADLAKELGLIDPEDIPAPEPERAPSKTRPIKYGTKRFWAKLIRDSAGWLEANPDKWTRGVMCTGSGKCCAIGAMQHSELLGDVPVSPEAYTLNDILWKIDSAIQNTFGDLIRPYRKAQSEWSLLYAIHAVNDDAKDVGEVIRFLRGLAFQIDHGGKTRAQYQAERK